MGRINNLGLFLLAIWLIATSLVALLNISFTGSAVILSLLALAAGVVILLGARKLRHNLGLLVLSIWLILTGLLPLINLSFNGLGTIMSLLALAAGVLLLLRRNG